MRALHIFNPEHDMALANGEANYMAPASARRMAAELASLPAWYAEPGDAVLAPSAYHLDFLRTAEERFGHGVSLLTEPELGGLDGRTRLSPWGWNPALKRRLADAGVDPGKLPSDHLLARLREGAHRLRAVELLPRLRLDERFCGRSVYLRTADECGAFVERGGPCLLKAPLSGSGKGLNWCAGGFTPPVAGWCARVCAEQGGVVGEPIYNNVQDFAMEFRVGGRGEVAFAGYSLFRTSGSGMYAGNALMSDGRILSFLSALVPAEAIERLRAVLTDAIEETFGGYYRGYLGVDMMVCRFPGASPEYRVHPCVEINLRMNMGVVARRVADRWLAPGAEGEFRVTYSPKPGEAMEEHRRMERERPLLTEGGRVRSGYMPLVPVTSDTRYRAFVLVAR